MSTQSNRCKLVVGERDNFGASDNVARSPIGYLNKVAPAARDTLRLTARAMACEFSVIMNAGEHAAIWQASEALDGLEALEQQMSAYRESSELSRLNANAHSAPVSVEATLYKLLRQARQISESTRAVFDITTGPLIQLWRTCRSESRLPTDEEIASRRSLIGMQYLVLDDGRLTLQFAKVGVSINLGAIGKGYALDVTMERIEQLGLEDVLFHGGRSSVLARGRHHGCDGWPVGLGNPLLTNRRLGTIVLQDQAMSTSGSNIQHFRIGDRRFGHILDPRTGWPANENVSVTAIAETAAEADALSTSFYAMKPAEVGDYCRLHPSVGAIVIPFPDSDRRVRPIVYGVDPDQIYWDKEEVRL